MFKKNIGKVIRKLANKFKSKNADVAIILYTIDVCLGSDQLLKGDSLERLSEFAQSLNRENGHKLLNSQKLKEKL